MRAKKGLERKAPLKKSAIKKVKKHLRKDGSVKRGYTTTGKVKLTTLRTTADNLARADCHTRGECQLAFWQKVKPPKTTGGKCSDSLQWAHIINRHNLEVRHDPDNAVLACDACHRYHGAHPDEFYQAVEVLDPGRHEYLYGQMRTKRNTDIRAIYEEWIAFYRAKRSGPLGL